MDKIDRSIKLTSATITIRAPFSWSDEQLVDMAERVEEQLQMGLEAVGSRIIGMYANGQLTYEVKV